MKVEKLLKELKYPTHLYRAKVFWSWNGLLEKDELIKQVHTIKQMGFGGFFIHSRAGLQTEYLSDEWFDLIECVALEANKLDLEVWLYDEDRWPSGTAGGIVTENKDYQLKFISLYKEDVQMEVIGRFAYKSPNDFYPVASKEEVLKGYQYQVYVVEHQTPSSFYNGNTYLDTMDKEAVQAFFESTLYRYQKRLGNLFKKVIKGIFTDEPHRGPLFNGFGIENSNRDLMIPYTKQLFSRYHELYDEDLKSLLPIIYFGDTPNEKMYQYVNALESLFLENYIKPYQTWCHQYGLMLTGHALHEDNLTAQTALSGSMMRFYEFMDIPGIDNLTMFNNCYWAVKQCSSVAKQKGKRFVLSEMYAASGWDSGFEQFKQVGDWQAFYGVNFRCLHLSMYTMEGEAKRDYPLSILQQSGLEKDWQYLETYFSRLNLLMTFSSDVTSLAAIHPVEVMWKHANYGWADLFTPTRLAAKKLEEEQIDQFNYLSKRHQDFDYIDEEHLSKAQIIEKNGQTLLSVGEKCYKEILITNFARKETKYIINAFGEKGGIVYDDVKQIPNSKIIETDSRLNVQIRTLDDAYVLIAMNFDRAEDLIDIPIKVNLDFKYAYEVDLHNNEYYELKLKEKTVYKNIYRTQEFIMIMTKEKLEFKAREDAKYLMFDENKNYQYELSEFNVLPIDYAKLLVDGTILENNVLLLDQYMRKLLNIEKRSNEMFQPWFIKKYQKDQLGKSAEIMLEYSFEVGNFNGNVYLAFEGDYEVKVNQKPPKKTDIYWKDRCFKVYNITSCLKPKINLITLKMVFNQLANIEGVYILGDFGVELPNRLVNLPLTMTPKKWISQGLPFYAGTVKFVTKEARALQFNKSNHIQYIKVGNNDEFGYATYFPYKVELNNDIEWIEYKLSPRNLFGPLHQKEISRFFAAPDSFLDITDKLNLIE